MRRTALVIGLTLAALVAALPASGETSKGKADAISGWWDASLAIPSGDVTFGLDLQLKGDSVKGAVLNGPERQEFTSGTFDGTTLTLRFDYYDGQITAHLTTGDRAELTGEYTRQTSRGIGRYEFRAVRRPPAPKFDEAPSVASSSLAGEWVLTLRNKDGKVDEVDGAVFTQGKGGPFGPERGVSVTGTIIPVSGDYGLLGGSLWKDEVGSVKFRMSRFDGIHVTRFWGEVLADGTIKGELASGQRYHVTLTGVRREVAEKAGDLPEDPFKMTTVKDPNEPFRFSGIDSVTGKTVASSDARYAGKVVLVDIFGTWCPNCHDEAPLLQNLYKKYQKDGLEIVALAYEYTDDAARNKRQIDVFRKKYGITFPILMVGTTAEGQIAKTLPQLQNFGAYPTTIFLGRDGRVRKIHAGFSGPATGHHFEEAKAEMEGLTRELLGEKATAKK
jgi:thiol-disulfide isomerase/thioredoxin